MEINVCMADELVLYIQIEKDVGDDRACDDKGSHTIRQSMIQEGNHWEDQRGEEGEEEEEEEEEEEGEEEEEQQEEEEGEKQEARRRSRRARRRTRRARSTNMKKAEPWMLLFVNFLFLRSWCVL